MRHCTKTMSRIVPLADAVKEMWEEEESRGKKNKI